MPRKRCAYSMDFYRPHRVHVYSSYAYNNALTACHSFSKFSYEKLTCLGNVWKVQWYLISINDVHCCHRDMVRLPGSSPIYSHLMFA